MVKTGGWQPFVKQTSAILYRADQTHRSTLVWFDSDAGGRILFARYSGYILVAEWGLC